MVNEGPGWHGERGRHREASLKGRENTPSQGLKKMKRPTLRELSPPKDKIPAGWKKVDNYTYENNAMEAFVEYGRKGKKYFVKGVVKGKEVLYEELLPSEKAKIPWVALTFMGKIDRHYR